MQSWYQNSCLEWITLELISRRHGTGLRDLQFHAALKSRLPKPNLSNLTTLQNSDIDPGYAGLLIPELIVENRGTLRQLKLGFERFAARNVKDYITRHRRAMLLAQEDFYDDTIRTFQELELQDNDGKEHEAWLCLESLHLVCFDFSKKSLAIFDFKKLKSLRLESCLKQTALRPLMFKDDNNNITTALPALKSFHLRYEKSNVAFLLDLRTFLQSISGLVHLSLLLEGPDPLQSLDDLLKNHGLTLETLVWDQRSGPRYSTSQPTDLWHPRHPGFYNREIASICPNLKELGIISEFSKGY